MTTTTDFEVTDYVQVVRVYLRDLEDEVRDELTDGLAADLHDLVVEQGASTLPDPELYADELRAAAGLPPRVRAVHGSPKQKQNVLARCDATLDAARERTWRAADSRVTRVAGSYVMELRPVWWCLRGQVAFWTWQTAVGGQNAVTLTPLEGALDLVMWTLFLLLSLRLGRLTRGHLQPGVRLWLLAVNSSALLAVPYFYDRLQTVLHR